MQKLRRTEASEETSRTHAGSAPNPYTVIQNPYRTHTEPMQISPGTHTQSTRNSFRTHSETIRDRFRINPELMQNPFRTDVELSQNSLRTHSEPTQILPGIHTESIWTFLYKTCTHIWMNLKLTVTSCIRIHIWVDHQKIQLQSNPAQQHTIVIASRIIKSKCYHM